jgi:hypothetical protein
MNAKIFLGCKYRVEALEMWIQSFVDNGRSIGGRNLLWRKFSEGLAFYAVL